MTLYEIDNQIREMLENSIDYETGELLLDEEALELLQLTKQTKIENIAMYIKETRAMATALREEEKQLAARRKSAENRADRLEKYLANALHGEKFETPRAKITFRVSAKVETAPEFVEWAKKNAPDLLSYKEPEPNKTEIKKILNSGKAMPYAMLSINQNMTIK